MFDILKALPAAAWFEKPGNTVTVAICRQSGMRSNIDCPDIDSISCSGNGLNAPQCNYHQVLHLDETQQYRVTENCMAPSNMVHKSWFTITPTMEWYYRRKHLDYRLPPHFQTRLLCRKQEVNGPDLSGSEC